MHLVEDTRTSVQEARRLGIDVSSAFVPRDFPFG